MSEPRTWKYPELTVIARFDDPETGYEMVTIHDDETDETWTRPSILMMIYMMGYGGAFSLLRPTG